MMTLRIALLGPPEVEIHGRPLVVDTRKAIAVLAYLACTGGPVPRDTLGFLLWPDSTGDRSRAALRRTLSSLRKGLGQGVLDATRSSVALAATVDRVVDVDEFEALVKRDDDSPGRRVEAWREAVDLYRGDFMSGFAIRDSPEFDDWQRRQAEYFRRLAANTLDTLATACADRGLIPDAVDAATRRLSMDALHEPAHRRLMLLHAAAGDRPAAIRQYLECVRVLDEELGVAPLDETTELYRDILGGAVAAVAEPTLASPLGASLPDGSAVSRPGFVGRDQHLTSLLTAHRAAARGLQVIALRGQAGIGKSRLLEEFIGSLDVPVVSAVSYEGETAMPHGATIALLRSGLETGDDGLGDVPAAQLAEAGRLVPELSPQTRNVHDLPPLDSAGGYQRLLESCARVLLAMTGGRSAGVLALDDAHWADEDSLRLLGVLIRRLQDEPALLVITYRNSEVAANRPLALVLREARRSRILTTVDLGRLEIGDVTALVETHVPERSDLAEEVHALSEGVPLFVVEYLAMLKAEGHLGAVPVEVRDVLTDQIVRRSELGRQILDAAAVIGRSFDFTTLRETAGRTDEETVRGLDELMLAGLVRELPDGGSFDFDHEQLRRLSYESMSLVRRRLLHGRVADSLRDQYSSADDGAVAASVAHHLQAAGRDQEAAEQHLMAATRAAGLYANEQALRHYEAALALGYDETLRVREAIGDLHALAGRYGNALANLHAAAAGSEGPHQAALEHKIGVVYTRAGDWELAEAAFESASRQLHGDGPAAARLLTDWAWLSHRRGDHGRSRELAERALDRAAGLEDPVTLARAHNAIGIVARAGDPAAAVAHHEESRRLVAGRDATAHAAALNNLSLSHLACGSPEVGLRFAYDALAVTERLGDRHKSAAVHSNLADLLHALGRDDDALEHLRLSAAGLADVDGGGDGPRPEIWTLTDW